MKRINRISAIAVVSLFFGCYEDKGNYNYVDVNEMEIARFASEGATVTVGEEIVIVPEFTFLNGSKDESHLTYQWSVNGVEKKEWNTRDFHYTPQDVERIIIKLKATDSKTGVAYIRNASLNVKSIYDAGGWMILSEKDGKSNLAFLKYKKAGVITDETIQLFPNVYGENLGTDPVMLQEHFCSDEQTKGAFLVLQNSGSVDVNGLTLKKELDFKEIFANGALPAGVTFQKVAFMKYVDVLTDQNGKLYSRIRSTKALFHSDYFLPEPIRFDDEELTDCHLIRGLYDENKFTVGYDNAKKRFFVIFDGETNTSKGNLFEAGKIVMLAAKPSGSPSGYVPLNNYAGYEIISAGYYRPASKGRLGISVLFRKISTGQYFREDFTIGRSTNSTRVSLYEPSFMEIKGILETPTDVCVMPYSNISKYLFVAVGNNLYLHNRENKEDGDVKLYATFDGKITSLCGEVFENKQIGVALENGRVHLVNAVDAKNNVGENNIMYSLPSGSNLGRIVDIQYKVGKGNGWE